MSYWPEIHRLLAWMFIYLIDQISQDYEIHKRGELCGCSRRIKKQKQKNLICEADSILKLNSNNQTCKQHHNVLLSKGLVIFHIRHQLWLTNNPLGLPWRQGHLREVFNLVLMTCTEWFNLCDSSGVKQNCHTTGIRWWFLHFLLKTAQLQCYAVIKSRVLH